MHTEIDYSKHHDEQIKQRHAIIDSIHWWGSAYKFRKILRDMRAYARYEGMSEQQARLLFGLGGVQGYPVEVIYARYIAPVNKGAMK